MSKLESGTVDCTKHGDVRSVCVYSHHCMYSADYECADGANFMKGSAECAPNVSCVLRKVGERAA